jgi:sporulation protein YlmC with PRC-barrel domain
MGSSRSGDVEGMKVFAQAGREIGAVQGLDIDLGDFSIRSMEIKLRREVLESLEMKVPLMGTQTIHLPVEHVEAIGDTVVLRVSVEELATLELGEGG